MGRAEYVGQAHKAVTAWPRWRWEAQWVASQSQGVGVGGKRGSWAPGLGISEVLNQVRASPACSHTPGSWWEWPGPAGGTAWGPLGPAGAGTISQRLQAKGGREEGTRPNPTGCHSLVEVWPGQTSSLGKGSEARG